MGKNGVSKLGKTLARFVLPTHIMSSARSFVTLSRDYGQTRSRRQHSAVDRDGNPIPWFTYPAIEYLKQFDLSQCRLFEYGSGNSTLFWAERVKEVVSVEDNEGWHQKMLLRLPRNVHYHHIVDQTDYASFIETQPGQFDIIVIDGICRDVCARHAIGHLADNGFLILDNSDWWDTTASFLRNHDLLEVDMAGFGPINAYTSTTSFFFRRNIRLTPLGGVQPQHSIAAVRHVEGQHGDA